MHLFRPQLHLPAPSSRVERIALLPFFAASAIVAALVIQPATAADVTAGTRQSSHLYYMVGGGNPASLAANPNSLTLKFGLSGNAAISYSCGKFKIGDAFSYYMTEFKNLGTTLQAAIGAAVAALPMYIFQRAQPGLYDLFHTYWAKAQIAISAALKTCEEMEAMIAKGEDPYEAYANLAKGEMWKVEASANTNVLAAKESVQSTGGKNGVQTFQGLKLGGKGQPPLRIVHDIVAVGYNATMTQVPSTSQDNAYPPTTPLGRLWSTPRAAADFAVSVLGDQEVATCDDPDCGTADGGSGKATVIGLGLRPKYEAALTDADSTLSNVVATGDTSYDNLQQVSAPGVMVNKDVVDALRRLPPESRGTMTKRLAAEVALSNTIERAFAIRNLLLTGMTAANYEKPIDDTRKRVEQLNRYIDDLMFEHRVRREMVSTTAQMLLAADQNSAASRSTSVPVGRETSPRTVEGGAVK